MAAPNTTMWEAAPHTLAKHAILRRYLQAWFPILAKHHGRLVYLDGFAGPGRYSQGEEGSPIIALNTALQHFAPFRDSQLAFVFVERKRDRSSWLRDVEIPKLGLPSHFETHIFEGEFEQILGGFLDKLDAQGLKIAPTFAFVDPFGITGLPFTLVERLLQRPHCEAFITFMSSSIHRFVTQLPDQVNTLLGDPHAAAKISASDTPGLEARRLYAESLRRVAKFVRFFEMRDMNGVPIYDLFLCHKPPTGPPEDEGSHVGRRRHGYVHVLRRSGPKPVDHVRNRCGRDPRSTSLRALSRRRSRRVGGDPPVRTRQDGLPGNTRKEGPRAA